MDKQAFISEFEEIVMVESGTVNESTELNDLEDWDSLTKVALEAFIEDKFGIKLDGKALNEFKTFGDVLKVVEGRLF
ncbi:MULTISPECIES: acyl carrier protein [Saccharibacillus]|uniref:acyl carrier protein n=1 Tax=Saccharibacillus TaxID=456492 RepID=UPI00123A748C|nr:acyl carrier protein [Saccharibacillus sp. WB 17]MWJ33247.1 hypothetical protein [Saccharibacillus sp. WB 17]